MRENKRGAKIKRSKVYVFGIFCGQFSIFDH
jgi:hypothetical protein